MFELSDVYTKAGVESHLGVIMCGEDEYQHLLYKVPYGFAHIKGVFETIMSLLGIEPMRYKIQRISSDVKEFHPGRSAEILIGKERVAVLGEAHHNLVKDFDLGKNRVIMMEMNLDKFIDMRVSPIKVLPPSRYQTVERDLALVVAKDVPASEIIRVIRQSGHNYVKNVEIFDVYEGEHVEQGYISLALKITYEDQTKSFTSEEIANIEKGIIDALNTKLKATLRG